MIHHISISAGNPRHVASVLAEVLGGKTYPFPGQIADSFMAVSGDEHGTMIEVYPADTTLVAGKRDEEQVSGLRGQKLAETSPFHALLSVPSSQAEIERIGAREGWRTTLYGRGAPGQPPMFHVIEFWVENRLMLELVPQDQISEYTTLIQPAKLDAFFGARA